jgi:4-hydroxy-2-oxoheptanedioate aldolase
MTDSLKHRLARGERVHVFAVSRLFHHNLILMLGQRGKFAGFWIDHEHAGLATRELEVAAIAGRSVGLDSFVRIAPTDYALVTRCLESGAGGVMAAQIRSAEHAEEFVRWAKFTPRGNRGLNSGGYDGGFGTRPLPEFIERANRESFVAIQIETLGALEEADAIAAIDGVDLLFVGPSDLSQALGVTGDFLNPRCLEALDRVASACRNHGKTWGAVTTTPEHAAVLVEKGCTMLSAVNDVRLTNAGIDAMLARFSNVLEQ